MFWAQVICFSIFIRNLYSTVLGISLERNKMAIYFSLFIWICTYIIYLPGEFYMEGWMWFMVELTYF